jgi:oligoendopeptidase F
MANQLIPQLPALMPTINKIFTASVIGVIAYVLFSINSHMNEFNKLKEQNAELIKMIKDIGVSVNEFNLEVTKLQEQHLKSARETNNKITYLTEHNTKIIQNAVQELKTQQSFVEAKEFSVWGAGSDGVLEGEYNEK